MKHAVSLRLQSISIASAMTPTAPVCETSNGCRCNWRWDTRTTYEAYAASGSRCTMSRGPHP